MNLSGIRPTENFYRYSDNLTQEQRARQIGESRAAENAGNIENIENAKSAESQAMQQDVRENGTAESGTAPLSLQAESERMRPAYSILGADSDVRNLDLQNAISDMKKDEVLKQYQFFVGMKLEENKYLSVRSMENFDI